MLALLVSALGSNLPAGAASTPGFRWGDVPAKYWAKTAIDTVAHRNPWMTDYGARHFRPNAIETRRYLAHAMVLAFAPDAPAEKSIRFKDMAPSDPFYRFASIAVKRGWLGIVDGNFRPFGPVTMALLHQAIVRALGLGDVAAGINRIHTTDGYRFKHPKRLGSLLVGMLLDLRYNHSDESLDVHPDDVLPRSEVAWSLYQANLARTQESWKLASIESDGYKNIHVGPISPALRKVVQFGLRYVGYPYIYAAEWGSPTPPDYCCGAQTQGGFDCSGLTWWVMKAPSGSYDPVKIRGYEGWVLGQRSSRDMASVGRKLTFKEARAGDLMFYSGDGNGVVDHVNTYLGYGWALDSSSGLGGVTIMHVDDGWYRDHFVHARRIVSS